MNLPAIDTRPRVRLWDDKWECFASASVPDGQRPIDVIEQLMGNRPLVRTTIDMGSWRTRWSGIVYRSESGELKEVSHLENLKFLKWPEVQF